LANIFKNKIIPLLQEYFNDDYEKIQLVLGDNEKNDEFKFILDKKVDLNEVFNGNPDDSGLPEKYYTVNSEAFFKIESYKQIGKGL
jgi:5-methylcytosine-specific restriction protein B